MVKLGSGAERLIDDFMLTRGHVPNNESVRDMLVLHSIKPEHLPAEEDIKKLKRHVKAEEKKLVQQPGTPPAPKE